MGLIRFIFSKEGLKHLFLIALAMVIFIFVIYFSLGFVTKHGSYIVVPNVKGKSFDEAVKILSKSNIDYEIMDSSYVETAPPLSVLEMAPTAGEKVKDGRKIYLTLNRAKAPDVTMPDLLDLSLNTATERLKALKLKLAKTTSKPDICKDCVIEQLYEGKKIKPGDKIPRGANIILVLGDGLGKNTKKVPNLLKMNMEDLKKYLEENKFVLGNITYLDDERDDTLVEVVRQNPQSDMGFKIQEGEMIDVWFKTKPKEEPEDSLNILMPPSDLFEINDALQDAINKEEAKND